MAKTTLKNLLQLAEDFKENLWRHMEITKTENPKIKDEFNNILDEIESYEGE